ncbi:MAG: hypothetical protein KGD64_12525 [Candidatus Heimdallarchaeota archaeon]|nr:hypothetical protein [Candidatus Heimdallarchaeota archaeon]
MISKTKIAMIALIGVFFVATISTAVAVPTPDVGAENREGSVFIETPDIRVKMLSGKPDIFFWIGSADENGRNTMIFHVSFHYITELFGDDLAIDSRDEFGGKIYNLASDQITWELNIVNTTNEITVTQTSSELDNGATLTFVYNVYLEDKTVTQTLNDTTYTYEVKALKEVKFDIIIEGWTFSEGVVGLALHAKIHENRYRHRVQNGDRVNVPEEYQYANMTDSANATDRTADPNRDGIGFYDDDDLKAYFAWSPEADVFDENGTYVDTVGVTATSTSFGQDPTFGTGRAFGREFINLFLVYPNYGDGLKLVHDPVLGIDDSNAVSVSLYALLALPVLAIAALAINRKRK